MESNLKSYQLFFKFLEVYAPTGFKEINRNDPLIQELELLTEMNNQFFFIGDMIQMQILFCSKGSIRMVGIDPNNVNPYEMNEATPPEDMERLGLAIANRMKMANTIIMEKKGQSLLSTTLKLKNPHGAYSNILYQCYTYYSNYPKNTVYQLQVHTNVDWCHQLKGKFHYYCGEDLSKFRYPDDELLGLTNPLSNREFEIIKLLSHGMSSQEIAEKIFLSTHTVNTHRRNILAKDGISSNPGACCRFEGSGLTLKF